MELPLPPDAPVVPDCATVHAKLAPTGDELKVMLVEVPEQIACEIGLAIATGSGLTVITTSIGEPTQVPILGVIV
jgi:hypothetical protein